MKDCTKDKNGFTLVELITTLVILAVITAMLLPPLLGFIDKTKEQRYIAEAQSIYSSVQMYTIEQYAAGRIDDTYLYLEVLMNDVNSKKNPLAPYLRITIPRRSGIKGITVNEKTAKVLEIVYLVDTYQITTGVDGTEIIVVDMPYE